MLRVNADGFLISHLQHIEVHTGVIGFVDFFCSFHGKKTRTPLLSRTAPGPRRVLCRGGRILSHNSANRRLTKISEGAPHLFHVRAVFVAIMHLRSTNLSNHGQCRASQDDLHLHFESLTKGRSKARNNSHLSDIAQVQLRKLLLQIGRDLQRVSNQDSPLSIGRRNREVDSVEICV